MEDDGPIAEMPSFISSFEDGRAKLSRSLPTETSVTDGKVERPVRDPSRRVTRSNSRLSLDGGERGSDERGGEEEKDAKGNNNNNCNGGGGERRRASAVDILRRNLGVSKSPSLRLNTDRWMQCGAEHESHDGSVDVDVTNGYGTERGDCTKSDGETGEAGTENEQTKSDLTTSDVRGVEFVHLTGLCRYKGDGDGNAATVHESHNTKEHVYCTVYCIAQESHRRGITDDETVTSDAPEMDLDTEQEAGSSLEPALYTLDDLVDPFGDMAHHPANNTRADAETAMQSCRVCLERKSIAPLPCCRKAVCDVCLTLYVSSMVGRREGAVCALQLGVTVLRLSQN